MKENNQNIKDKRVPKFIVKEAYPFSAYKVGATIQPVGELYRECLKFPRIFKDATIQFKVIDQNENAILSVERLRDGHVFKIGDTVEYTLGHLTETVVFNISAFQETEDGNMVLCWCSNVRGDSQAKAAGINAVTIHTGKHKGTKYFELK